MTPPFPVSKQSLLLSSSKSLGSFQCPVPPVSVPPHLLQCFSDIAKSWLRKVRQQKTHPKEPKRKSPNNSYCTVEDLLFVSMHTWKTDTSHLFICIYFAGSVSQRQTKATVALHPQAEDSPFPYGTVLECSTFPTSKNAMQTAQQVAVNIFTFLLSRWDLKQGRKM